MILTETVLAKLGDTKKRPRTAFTPDQIKRLETEFLKNKYLSVGKRIELSKTLELTETQVFKSLILSHNTVLGRSITTFTKLRSIIVNIW